MKSLLTVEQLSTCLHKSVASIRSDATRNLKSLPPLCRLPGTKRLFWRAEDVEQWLAEHVQGGISPKPIQSNRADLDAQPRRGRPTKAMQVASARHQTVLSAQVQLVSEANR